MTDYERKCHRLILDVRGQKRCVFASTRGKKELTEQDKKDIQKVIEEMEAEQDKRNV